MYIFCLLPLHVASEKCYTLITKPIGHIRVATNLVIGALYPKYTRYLSETTQNARYCSNFPFTGRGNRRNKT